MAAAGEAVARAGLGALPIYYVMFAAHAMQSTGTDWLRTWRARTGAVALAVASALAHGLFINTAMVVFNSVIIIAAATFAFTVAWQQFHRTTGAPKARAREYLIAFAMRDAIYVTLSVTVILSTTWEFTRAWFDIPVLMFLISDAFIVHGLMRGQILALENKVVQAAAGAVAAALLVTAFVVTTESIEEVVAGQDAVIGIIAAVVLTLAFGPLQRASQRALRSLFPAAKPLGEMSKTERIAEYREFLELALADGVIDSSERTMLDRMADRLGIDAKTARAMEA